MSDAIVQGTVHLIEATKTYGQNGFRKRLVVLEQPKGRFANYIPVNFIQDDCDSADEMHVGDEVEITYRLSGRKWQRDPSSDIRFFLDAEAISFQILTPGVDEQIAPPPAEQSEEITPLDEDIPF